MLYILLLIIFIIIIYLFKSFKVNVVITVLCSMLIIYIVVSPIIFINSTISGAKLFFYNVFPSLFPFLIISNILIRYDGIKIYEKLFGSILCKPIKVPSQCSIILIISILCGYPLGAKYSTDLYEKGYIDLKTYKRLINIASNASPLFIVGTIGTSMLNNRTAGYILLFSNYASCIFMGFITIPLFKNKNNDNFTLKNIEQKHSHNNFGSILKDSLNAAVNTCLSIGSYIIIFSVLSSVISKNILFNQLINNIPFMKPEINKFIKGFVIGLLEMTNGCNIISNSTINIYYKIIAISFLLSFSGLSIISQVYSFTYKFNTSIQTYVVLKTIQGFISSITTIVVYKLLLSYRTISITAFNSSINLSSSNYVNVIILCLLMAPLIFEKIKKILHIS
jgi:sporulation integral membrane protein YlbJ